MTGHDQFREGIKGAVLSGAFAGDFETHPVGTSKRVAELESLVEAVLMHVPEALGGEWEKRASSALGLVAVVSEEGVT